MLAGGLRITFYMAFVLAPLFLAALLKPVTNNGFLYEIGRGFALISFIVLNFQPLLASRLKWIERPFGLDIVIRHHKYMAVFATFLLICHPPSPLNRKKGIQHHHWNQRPVAGMAGRVAIVVLLANMFFSFSSLRGRIRFETWRNIHDVLGPFLLGVIFVHSFFQGGDLKMVQLASFWAVVSGAAAATFVYHRLVRPRLLRRHAYNVIDVHKETGDVWTVKLSPPEGAKRFDYLPGQFQFLTFYRERGLPVEEHHWTISSAPAESVYVSSTIKDLGDFTSTIGKTKPGDTAAVHAPFVRFSHVLHHEEDDLVFIAGGIGITPLMSMLRHMRDTRSDIRVLLLYANRTEEDIVFNRELQEIEAGEHPRLKTVHILSEAGEGWHGETGYIDSKKIERFCGSSSGKAFYLCGPAGLVDGVIKILKGRGVRDSRMHREIFSFVN